MQQQALRPLPVSFIASGSVHLGLVLLLALTAKEAARDLITVDLIEIPSVAPAPSKTVAPRSKISVPEKTPVVTETLSESDIAPVQEAVSSEPSAIPLERQASAKELYQSQLVRQLNSRKSYPALAKKLRQEGLVVVQFRVGRSGQILEARVVKESPFQTLNQSARDLVKGLKGLAPLPQEIVGTTWVFEVPVQYQM